MKNWYKENYTFKATPHNACCAVAPPDFSSDNTN